ncbi:MAG: hypothetical protein ABW039_00895 [Sphingobium sp.]
MASLPAADPRLSRPATAAPPALWVALAWLLCCLVMLWLFRGDLTAITFRDPDDAMRLQQVRDWIGGQAFHDVSQHRINPPFGGPMHWSRIVDMPIAASILLLRPMIGAAGAELAAITIVPLLLLGGLAAALHRAARLIGGTAVGLLACGLLLTTPSILVQFTPLRIDHHGWQIMLAAIALCGAFDARAVRGGALAGLAIATWLQISSEGLPYAALFAGVFALRQWFAREEAPRFIAFAGVVGVAALALLTLLRGWPAVSSLQCDALSRAYVWPLLGFAAATVIAARLIGAQTAFRRAAVIAIGGTTAIALFLLTGGPCLSGDPFAALGPVAYRLWYLQVMEGRPIWEQGLAMAGIILLPALAGLIGALAAAWTTGGEVRARWLALALLTGGAMLVACMVMRALSVAHLMALPGAAWLILSLLAKAGRAAVAPLRIVGTLATMLLTPVGLSALAVAAAPTPAASSGKSCRTDAALAPLRTLPPSLLLAPLDLGPDILVRSGHSVIGTAHHRNAAGITSVIEAFVAPPDKARTIVAGFNGGKGAAYVVICPGMNEMGAYAKDSPDGLAAQLASAHVPAWLTPLPAPGPLRIYRFAAGTKASATPFMQ